MQMLSSSTVMPTTQPQVSHNFNYFYGFGGSWGRGQGPLGPDPGQSGSAAITVKQQRSRLNRRDLPQAAGISHGASPSDRGRGPGVPESGSTAITLRSRRSRIGRRDLPFAAAISFPCTPMHLPFYFQ